MAIIPLKRPVEHEGKSWTEIDFDPSLGALEQLQKDLLAGVPEITAMIALIVADGDVPIEVAKRVRQSDLEAVQAEIKPAGPLASSTASSDETGADGGPSRPILHTS